MIDYRMNDPELLEILAAIEHARWSGWEIYRAIARSPENEERWKRQAGTPYAELSEGEKESDRAEVRKTLDAIRAYLMPPGSRPTWPT